jgi:hypothetical protein
MDILKLEDSYLPGPMVEGYTSMIWTERFTEAGDFSLVTPQIQEMKLLIPEGSLLTHRETEEIMQVETHNIEVDDDGIPNLVVEGRTLETASEKRAAMGVHGEPWSSYKNYTASEIASLLLWTYLVDTTGQDASRVGGTHDVDDAVPGFVVTDSTTLAEVAASWSLQEGVVYSQLRDILTLGRLGVRAIRPPGTTGNIMTFDTSGGGTRGDVSKVSTPGISGVRLDVYNGLDRTRFQTDREPVIFHYDSGHINSPKYLSSIKDFYNVALVTSSLGVTEVWPETGTTPPSTPPTGLDRRVLFVDGGTQGDALLADFTQSVIQKGMVELAKHNRMILFDGQISAVSPYKYKTHYFLGDDVSLLAQYGFEDEMVVAEYVRTEDKDGDRGYPTLIRSSQEG